MLVSFNFLAVGDYIAFDYNGLHRCGKVEKLAQNVDGQSYLTMGFSELNALRGESLKKSFRVDRMDSEANDDSEVFTLITNPEDLQAHETKMATDKAFKRLKELKKQGVKLG